MSYAIIETGGKQFKVEHGSVILVEKLKAEVGDTVQFDRIVLANKDGVVLVDPTALQQISISGRVEEQGKHKKIRIFKYKSKSNYRRRMGHRQPFTKVTISITGL